jgi:ACT domain-containing protein
MKAILTIIGKDRVGIIAAIAALLAGRNVNILDINQTVMKEYFTMFMLVDLEKMNVGFSQLQNELDEKGKEINMNIRIQREDIFEKMYQL